MLEMQVGSDKPSRTDVMTFVGFFMLHLMRNIPAMYHNIGEQLLQNITSNEAYIIATAFETYPKYSIKDSEHQLQGIERIESILYHHQIKSALLILMLN